MTGLRLAAASAALAIAAAASASAQDLPPDARAQVEAIVDAAPGKLPLRAVLAGVAVGDEAPWLLARGETMTGVPATPDMRFRNGAVAIAYLGTVLLQQAERGVVALDDPVSTWLPNLPQADKVTLDMLIHGTSGYADYVPDAAFLQALHDDPFRAWSPEELLAIGLGQPMHCDPGACWSYAHTNFVILGEALSRASEKPLAALIREGVVEPLGLTGTRSDQTAAIPEPVLHAFDSERGRYEESTFWDPSWTLAEGAVMTSTIEDVLKSAAAIGEGTLVSEASHEIQLARDTARFAPWNDRIYYAFGHFVINGWIVQNPSFSGYAATMAYLPARKLAIAVATTVTAAGDPDTNYSTEVLKEIAAALAPEAPM